MRLQVPFRGIHVGKTCVDGGQWRERECAHAHLSPLSTDKFSGYICARTNTDMMAYLRHEVAHLLTGDDHSSEAAEARWRAGLRSIGGRIAAKQPRQR